ncbi:conserved Plasmodium protein, unknown function [Plasmodium vivax]|nr:conserved Plasmodium protein, unknown function [Plasmodium vivax]
MMRSSEDPLCDANDAHSAEPPLGSAKKNSLHIFGTHRDQSDSKKKRVQCRGLPADGQYEKEIFRKMKHFYKNDEKTSLGCDRSVARGSTRVEETPSDEKVRGEEAKEKNGSVDENMEENKAKPFSKKRKTLLHEVAYVSPESNSKRKRQVGRGADAKEPIGSDHNEFDNRNFTHDEVNRGDDLPTGNLLQRGDKTDGSKGAEEPDRGEADPSSPLNEYAEGEGSRGENESNGGCTIRGDKTNAQISCDGGVTAHYENDKEGLSPLYNSLEVSSERRGGDHTSAVNRRSSIPSDKESGRNKASDLANVDACDSQRGEVPNEGSHYPGADKASTGTASCEEELNGKMESKQKGEPNIGGANGKGEATVRNGPKHAFKGSSSAVKSSIVEKKKKIKSIHNEILSLISADSFAGEGELTNYGVDFLRRENVSLGGGDQRGKQLHTGVNGKEENGKDPQIDSHTGMLSQYQLVSPSEERLLLEDYKSVCRYQRGSLQKGVHQVEHENGGGVQSEEVTTCNRMDKPIEEGINRHSSTSGSQNRPLEKPSLCNAELVGKGPRSVMIRQKGDIHKEKNPHGGRIAWPAQPKSSLLRKAKLIYEREKKTLEINRKYLNKYGYFKIILNTYSRNDLLNMSEHGVDFDLSKILFSHDIIKKINRVNFKTVIKALDFYGYLYDHTFLKRLSNKVTINEWLCNSIFFQKIFTRKELNVGIFYDLVYYFLYLNPAFVHFFFSKNGGKFVKRFSLYDRCKAIRLVNKVVAELKIIRPSTDSVVRFLFGFFSHTKGGEEARRGGSKRALRGRERREKDNSAGMPVEGMPLEDVSITNMTMGEWTPPVNRSDRLVGNPMKRKPQGRREKNTHVYIKNAKFKKTGLRNILNKIWQKNDLYVREEVYYGNNFTVRRRVRGNEAHHLNMLNNLLFESNGTTSASSAYSFGGEGGLGCGFDKSGEVNFGRSGADGGGDSDDDVSGGGNVSGDGSVSGAENVRGGENVDGCDERRATKTFHSLDCVPNVSFDLFSQEGDSFQRGDSYLTLCFKEEEKCNTEKYVKDVTYLGIRVSSKENKINGYNCFDVNLKVYLEEYLLADVKYNISKEGDYASAFFPVWPHNPDYFGYQIGRNIKKEFSKMRKSTAMKERGEVEKKSIGNVLNKMDGKAVRCGEYVANCTSRERKKKFLFSKRDSRPSNAQNNSQRRDSQEWKEDKTRNVDHMKIKDCCFVLNVKIYPMRTLALYLLYNALYQDKNAKILELYSSSLNKETKEWLLLFLLPHFVNKCIHKVTYPLKLTRNIFSESNEFYEDFFSNEYLKINEIEKIIIYTKNNSDDDVEICPFSFCYLWLKSTKQRIDRWISSKINEVLFTFPFANFLLSKYFSNFILFIQLFHTCLDIDHMYLCKSHFYVSLKHNLSFLHESLVSVLFSPPQRW